MSIARIVIALKGKEHILPVPPRFLEVSRPNTVDAVT